MAAVNDGGTEAYSDPALTEETLQNGEYMKSVHSVVVLPCFALFVCIHNLHTCIVHTQSTAIHLNAIQHFKKIMVVRSYSYMCILD